MKILCLILLTAAALHAQRCRIAGTVVDSTSNASLPRVRVTVAPQERVTQETSQYAASDGSFSFDVDCGKYILSVIRGEIRQHFGQRSSGDGFGTSIITSPDLDTAHLVFPWHQPGAILGKVTDEYGEPVENALVQVVWNAPGGGVRRHRTFGWHWTNDLGEYYFSPVPEGTFYVVVTGTPWYANHRRIGATVQSADADAYLPTYFPNASDPSGAGAIVVRPGAEIRADVSLRAAHGAKINVHLDSAPRPTPNTAPRQLRLLTVGVQGTESQQGFAWLYGDNASFGNVPPGRYTVRLNTSGSDGVFAQQSVDVGATDVDVTLSPHAWPTVTGTVELESKEMASHGTLLAGLLDLDTNSPVWTRVAPDGSFTIPAGPIGKARVLLSGPDGFFPRSVSAEGASVDGDTLDIPGGAPVRVRIVASDATGSVKGFATSGAGAQEGALVVLAPVDASATTNKYDGFQSDSDGSFDFRSIRAGDYFLFAVDDTRFEYARRNLIEPFLAQAKRIHIDRKSEQKLNIPILPVNAPAR